MKKTKAIINFFGGPGIGKSGIAAGVFYRMKEANLSVELVSEYAKELVFEERKKVLEQDQLYVFALQHRKLYRIFNCYDYIIIDSPVLLSYLYYDEEKSFYSKDVFKNLVTDVFDKYPNYNFLLTRNGDHRFEQEGRVQTYEQSLHIDHKIKNFLDDHKYKYYTMPVNGKTVDDVVDFFIEKNL